MITNNYSQTTVEPELIRGAFLMVPEAERFVSSLGLIFSYDGVENILLVTLHHAHVLPRAEAERFWKLAKAYAASLPSHPSLVLEVEGKRVEYGPVEPTQQHFAVEYNRQERQCLFLMSPRVEPLKFNLPLANMFM